MKIPLGKFMASLSKKTMQRLLDTSLLPFREGERPGDREAFLTNLHRDVMSRKYFPSLPRGYIVLDKHNGVTRIIPVFSYRDMCVYYLCVNEIEEYIATNRVPGTYGGYMMGNPNRKMEDIERAPSAEDEFGYYLTSAIDPMLWVENFRNYVGREYDWSGPRELQCFLKFDIANFYDSINLDILERKIRAVVPREKYEAVDLLFVLLRNWNRGYEGYGSKTVGIPQNDAGDCSRLLANFYLQDYDEFIYKQCEVSVGLCRYVRYADDQTIMAETPEAARYIMFAASRELHKIGLNINSGKVIEFSSRDAFEYYWSFDIHGNLNIKKDLERINLAAQMFIERLESNGWDSSDKPWRADSILKRLLNIGLMNIALALREKISALVMTEKTILKLDALAFEKVYEALNMKGQDDLIVRIESLIPVAYYNNFHLNVLQFYKKCRKDIPVTHIENRLAELNEQGFV